MKNLATILGTAVISGGAGGGTDAAGVQGNDSAIVTLLTATKGGGGWRSYGKSCDEHHRGFAGRWNSAIVINI